MCRQRTGSDHARGPSTLTASEITERAEASCALLVATLAAHRGTVARQPTRSRTRRLAPPAEDRAQIQCQATLVRLLSITEAFCVDRLLDQVELAVAPDRHPSAAGAWDDAAIGATRSWNNQKRAYKQWLGVGPSWTPIEHLAHARNAVAHGLGALTRQQLRDVDSVIAKLKLVGIPVQSERVVLSDSSLATAAMICREFIRELDLAVQNRPSKYQ